jgi:hypothetical protein
MIESGIEAPIDANTNRQASSKTGVGSDESNVQILYADRDSYKDSIMRATKARFDNISR